MPTLVLIRQDLRGVGLGRFRTIPQHVRLAVVRVTPAPQAHNAQPEAQLRTLIGDSTIGRPRGQHYNAGWLVSRH